MRKVEAMRCSVAICVSHHLFSSTAVDGGDVVGRSLGVERRMMDASEVTVLSFLTCGRRGSDHGGDGAAALSPCPG